MGIDVQGSGLPVQLIPLDKVHHLLASDLNVRHGVTASVRGGRVQLLQYLPEYVRHFEVNGAASFYSVVSTIVTLLLSEHISGQQLWHQRTQWETPLIRLQQRKMSTSSHTKLKEVWYASCLQHRLKGICVCCWFGCSRLYKLGDWSGRHCLYNLGPCMLVL